MYQIKLAYGWTCGLSLGHWFPLSVRHPHLRTCATSHYCCCASPNMPHLASYHRCATTGHAYPRGVPPHLTMYTTWLRLCGQTPSRKFVLIIFADETIALIQLNTPIGEDGKVLNTLWKKGWWIYTRWVQLWCPHNIRRCPRTWENSWPIRFWCEMVTRVKLIWESFQAAGVNNRQLRGLMNFPLPAARCHLAQHIFLLTTDFAPISAEWECWVAHWSTDTDVFFHRRIQLASCVSFQRAWRRWWTEQWTSYTSTTKTATPTRNWFQISSPETLIQPLLSCFNSTRKWYM